MTDSIPAWLHSAHHDGSQRYVSQPQPAFGSTVQLRLRVAQSAPIRRIFLRTFPDGEQMFAPLDRAESVPPVQWWTVDLTITEPLMHYRFVIEADDGVWWVTANGPTAMEPLDSTDFRLLAAADLPRWVPQAVFYQIFPDRFANGDPTTDPQPDDFEYEGQRPHTLPWGSTPPDERFNPLRFYGGDLPGLTQRLDYLADLGVTALYLNPIFTAYSNHKYDVADYETVDPHFGGNDALVALRSALTARNMRYILDIVPNHCGFWHPWFAAARADASVPEADFFTFHDHPTQYESWLGVWSLPKLNYRSHLLRTRMIDGPDAIFRRWLRPPFSADGWRIDVANMLGRQGESQQGVEISRAVRRAVKETAPDSYLLGENFFDASPQLQGDQLDGVMNYMGFTHPLIWWLSGYKRASWGMKEAAIESARPWPTEALAAMWQSRLASIPWSIALRQFNLLGSHDTPRIRTLLGENDALHRLAAIVQFTFPGVPCIYYGDEIGLVDAPVVGSRGCMTWDAADWHDDLHDFYRRLIALRRRSSTLQEGGFQLLTVAADALAFMREGPAGRVLVVANRSQQAWHEPIAVARGGVPDGTRFVPWDDGGAAVAVDNGVLALPAQPQGAAIWLERV